MSMKVNILLLTLVLITCVTTALLPAQGHLVLFREEFTTLDQWRPLYFPKIKKHSSYTIQSDGEVSVLKAESNASASALIFKKTFNVYEYPLITWRWKVENIYEKGNEKTKEGDDYPLRVYVIFEYNPTNSGFLERLKYASAKLLYGEYPPHSSLNYIWANRNQAEKIITSSYTERAKMILLQSGPSKVGTWQTEEVNIVEDYERAFGTKPPAVASLAMMNDSDNTGEHSVSCLDYIEVYKSE